MAPKRIAFLGHPRWWVRAPIGLLIGLVLGVSVLAEPLLEGRVRLESGEPAVGAQVLLFDLADLRAAPLAATTDRSGHFTLPLASLSGVLPEQFELGANYPNPFNPSTMIPYQLPVSMHVRLEVYNLLGQLVATLVDGEQPAGSHTASWDATDEAGQAVGAGVYLYRLSGDGVQATRSMLLIDGQAGVSLAGPAGATPAEEEAGEKAPVYALTVSGPGLIPYVDPAFRVEAGMPPLDLVVEAPGSVPPAKAAFSGGILGDVDNTDRVDFFDAVLVALFSRNSSIVMPNNGDISLGDVDADGRVDLTDAWLIAVYLNDPSNPALPSGIGEPLGPAASLSPDPSTVTFADDGTWHRFTVEAGQPVSVMANPGTTPRLEITTRSGRGNYCPAEADDDVSRRDGQTVYLSGCATGTATVELRRQSDDTVLNTYTFEVTGSPADLVVQSVSVSDSTLTPGQSLTLRATVRNQGTARSGATTLQYYRSTNRTISTQDTEIGTDQVDALGASRTSAESIPLTAPSAEGTYYYGACVVSVAGESGGNNCSSAVTVTVGAAPAPDLVVDAPTVSNSSPTAGASFTLRATVRNQGTGQSAAATLRWYRSSNATISTRDSQVGTDPVSSLSASRTSAESISLRAPSTAGTYYYGACVESVSDESDPGNNCSSAVTVTVGAAPAPDLVVDAPTVSNSSPTAGASFTLRATVRNQGSGQSAATLRWYRSSNATVSTSDTQVGTDPVSSLSASGTSSESISLRAPSSPGTYYYGACVESVSDESDTGNNCSAAVTVTVGAAPAPDLVLDAPTVSTSGPAAGASFTLSATVRNQGAARSSSTTLRYYRSTDATVSTSDTQVGTDPVSSLSASRTSSESISLRAPSSAGTYYYGACVDSVSDETDTGNNCSSAVTVTVGAAPAPDLVVDAPTVSNSSPTAGASFRLNATVRNQGNGQSAATTLRFYRSTNATISASDTEVGSHAVGGLAASGTSDHSTDLTAPSSVGTYYYGACVESVSDETNTGNNCSSAVTVTVGAAPAPDLVVDAPTVSNSSPTAGASFTLSATVRNQGNGQSAATTLRFYRSTNATISASDTEVGSRAVGGLAASGTSDLSTDLTAPSSVGTYYYGACVESVSDETNTGNNCSSAVTVTVGAAPAPDLVVDAPTVSNSSPTAGASFTLSATVRNQGNGQSAATTLRFYRSTNATISASDTEVGSRAVGGLAASGTSDLSTDLTAPSSAGTYYYGACVESVSGESATGNNCSSAFAVTVGTPDLVVGTPQATSRNPTAGASFHLSVAIENQGTGPSAATTLRFYRSTDGTISASDTEVGSHAVSLLGVGVWHVVSAIPVTAPSSAGTYYYGACVESVSGESNTENNCSPALTVNVVSAPAPDLVVDAPTASNSSPTAGASFTLSATVRNQGNGPSAATTLRFYRSTDATISDSDNEVGSHAVGGLAASGTSDHSSDLTTPSDAGTYYYGACVGSVSDESDTGNNCSPAVTVTVSATVTQPDPQPAAVSKLYWSDWGTDKIQRADLDGSNVEDLISGAGLDGPDGLSLDLAGGKIYWVDAGTKKIQRANLDGSGIEDLLTDQNFPFGLALDVSGGKMYWTNPFPAKIQRANLDGSGPEDLVTSGLTIAGGLALDVAGGKMYWTNRGTAPGTAKIQRADLSGSNVEDLVTSGLTGPHGLALDVAGGKMYWTDRGTDKIQRADLSGSNVEDLVTTGLDSPSGIALDVAGGKIYWTDGGTNKVQRANLDGTGVEDLLTGSDGLIDPSGIALGVEAVSGSN